MLSGSLIMFFAIKMGITCPQLFSDLALTAKPRISYDRKSLKALSEAACAQEETDSYWVSAYIKSGFNSKIVATPDGKFIFANKADSFMKNATIKALVSVSVGSYLLPGMALKGTVSAGSPEEYLKADNQIKYLSTSVKAQFFEKCQEEWLRCWSVNDRSTADRDYWKSVEVLLAKSALAAWNKKESGTSGVEEPMAKDFKKKTSAAGTKKRRKTDKHSISAEAFNKNVNYGFEAQPNQIPNN